ncbi:hypothetical protein KFL_001910150 [Klebsormidium nitens]|uniref:VTT domain-containing protein n=1 Tax=Klebsormidium nitens TaxID=105231 RepID=A0A1Y1I6Y9_KLENI|nr:hypothetical protein KFL_001910150 [Klebsormidium nitens]|eukprot:GAQ84496.1 hypothetical protein KFL_001910150 [Klebsormidium nitens]
MGSRQTVALVLAALLLLVWRRPSPAFAAAVAGDQGAGAGGAAFKFGAFGLRGSLTDRTPGLAYFALLMAAGCGLFVSEEALNVWVGGSLGRCLVLDGTREALMQSLRANWGYIASVIFWVYWGVCLSDLIPFYAGKWAAQRGESVTEKLGGTNQATLARVTSAVRKYGAYIGLVERFSLGVRNPTAFLAGFSGVSTSTFFIGVCAGGLFTLPLQMGLGFVLRDRPVAALATVAAVVGTWTVVPYASAALAAAWFFVKQRLDKKGDAEVES